MVLGAAATGLVTATTTDPAAQAESAIPTARTLKRLNETPQFPRGLIQNADAGGEDRRRRPLNRSRYFFRTLMKAALLLRGFGSRVVVVPRTQKPTFLSALDFETLTLM